MTEIALKGFCLSLWSIREDESVCYLKHMGEKHIPVKLPRSDNRKGAGQDGSSYLEQVTHGRLSSYPSQRCKMMVLVCIGVCWALIEWSSVKMNDFKK